ncbi:hypothetical protein BST97_03960 [Nonlabens spongiae]|uniref:Uncharacterized protein n=1 Tax=Nonlabens spongiae TaxID=331648 RepID=A0A1W6MHX6_9FLAO|nr:hypothetical protein [Nonlabens spongiae]ARN77205.1 hypothetical protein BST97_03960 [Nonlabens spongiae]
METINVEIHTHDNEVDIAHKINAMELQNWINHLNYIKSEVSNLIVFYNVKSSENRLEQERLTQRFEMIQVDNEVILAQLNKFKASRDAIDECDNMQCDMTFIQEHETCRRMYLFHIDKYRKLKDTFFAALRSKMEELAKYA